MNIKVKQFLIELIPYAAAGIIGAYAEVSFSVSLLFALCIFAAESLGRKHGRQDS